MYYHNGSVYVEDEDQCQTCANFAKDVNCPLLQALGMGLVTLTDTLYVSNCGFYKEFKRNLKVVKDTPDEKDEKPPQNNIRTLNNKKNKT